MLMLVTSGLAHLPPIKVVTILAGVDHVGFVFFIVSAFIARGARFLALAWLLRRYGEPIRDFIEKRLGLIAAAAAAVLDRSSICHCAIGLSRGPDSHADSGSADPECPVISACSTPPLVFIVGDACDRRRRLGFQKSAATCPASSASSSALPIMSACR